MNSEIFDCLKEFGIGYYYYSSPEDFINEDDKEFWAKNNAKRCKNLFLRDHKGKRHFLVVLDYYKTMDIKILEAYYKKGKISFASDKRLKKYLNTKQGAVSLLGLAYDTNTDVEVIIDKDLLQYDKLSFLANNNKEFVVITKDDAIGFVEKCGNDLLFMEL